MSLVNIRTVKNLFRRLLGEKYYYRITSIRRRFREKIRYSGRTVIDDNMKAALLLREAMASGRPFCCSRIGACEMRFLREAAEIQSGLRTAFSSVAAQEINVNAGVYPVTKDIGGYFLATYRDCVRELDFICACYNKGEEVFLSSYAPSSTLIRLLAVDPVQFAGNSWLNETAGKRVLVISPFVKSIESQYRNRQNVWRGCPGFLPDFELICLRAPLSAGLTLPEFEDWRASLEDMKVKMNSLDFDVAIVGAGAYSLPLVAHAKRMNRVGIHLGGATQLIFGIMGGRWEANETVIRFKNEHWVRPSGDEIPKGIEKVEGGCYW